MSGRTLGLVGAAFIVLGTVSPALAQRHDEFRHDEGWRDRDMHRFRDRDFDRWRGGHWVRTWHEGRRGWWWIVGPNWYYYPAPVYPYPDPYLPPGTAPAAGTWYFCPPAQAYYPYVATCPMPWQAVPAR